MVMAPVVRADQISDANHVIEECNKTVQSADKVISLKTREINTQNELIDLQDKQIKDLTGSKNSIFNNPFLYFALGLVVGVVIVK
jgi:hypothetical protein